MTEQNRMVEFPNGIIVKQSKAIGVDWHTYSVWVPNVSIFGEYSTITSFKENGTHYGKFQTMALPAHIANMQPMTQERIDAVKSHYSELYVMAYEYIYKAFPNLANLEHTQSDGNVEYFGNNPA